MIRSAFLTRLTNQSKTTEQALVKKSKAHETVWQAVWHNPELCCSPNMPAQRRSSPEEETTNDATGRFSVSSRCQAP
jgi:hypothetical protein